MCPSSKGKDSDHAESDEKFSELFGSDVPQLNRREVSELNFVTPDSVLKSPCRFNIMMMLYTFKRLRNKSIYKQLKITPGNLDHHSKVLIEKGWVSERYIFEIRPLKVLEITKKGEETFYCYAQNLKQVLRSLDFDI